MDCNNGIFTNRKYRGRYCSGFVQREDNIPSDICYGGNVYGSSSSDNQDPSKKYICNGGDDRGLNTLDLTTHICTNCEYIYNPIYGDGIIIF